MLSRQRLLAPAAALVAFACLVAVALPASTVTTAVGGPVEHTQALAIYDYDSPAAPTTIAASLRGGMHRADHHAAERSHIGVAVSAGRLAARGGSALGTRMTGAAYGDIVRHYARSVGRATAERLRYARGYPQRWAARHPVAADWMRFGSEVVERYNDPGEEALRQGIRALKDLFG